MLTGRQSGQGKAEKVLVGVKGGRSSTIISQTYRACVKELGLNEGKAGLQGVLRLHDVETLTTLSADDNALWFFDFKNLPNLTELDLCGNHISDLSFLASLTNLTSLNLSSNEICDLWPLSSLTGLKKLILWNNEQIRFLKPLAGLTELTELSLSVLIHPSPRDSQKIEIMDLQPLASLIGLRKLSLGGKRITDLNSLAGLTALTELSLRDMKIDDLRPLASLINLAKLDLCYNRIDDLRPLGFLTSLTILDLWNNQINDLRPLSYLTNLIDLNLSDNSVSDLWPLASLTNLRKLKLWENNGWDDEPGITDLRPLANLTKLTELDLGSNRISDIRPLAGLTGLTDLDLEENPPVSDIQPLAFLTNLRKLKMHGHEWGRGPIIDFIKTSEKARKRKKTVKVCIGCLGIFVLMFGLSQFKPLFGYWQPPLWLTLVHEWWIFEVDEQLKKALGSILGLITLAAFLMVHTQIDYKRTFIKNAHCCPAKSA